MLAMARRFPQWRFVAVDPAAAMLEVCKRKMDTEGVGGRCEFHDCLVDELPEELGGFDAATSILVSHFITGREERLSFFKSLKTRMRRGGVLLTSDLSLPPRRQLPEVVKVWRRMLEFAGADSKTVEAMLAALGREVSLLAEGEFEGLLVQAGFEAPALYSQALLIRSWFARAG